MKNANLTWLCSLIFWDASSWKYNANIREYFVETETKQSIKQSELRRQQEISDLGETYLDLLGHEQHEQWTEIAIVFISFNGCGST